MNYHRSLIGYSAPCPKPEQKRILKSDCAPEYCTQQLEDMLRTKHGVTEIRHSNEHQQFQNALVEKCVDSLGKMIRAMLLQSQLPPEFWGCSVMLITYLANCRPHDSLEGLHFFLQVIWDAT